MSWNPQEQQHGDVGGPLGAPQHGQAPSDSGGKAPGLGMRRWGMWLTIVGGALFLVSLLVGIALVWNGASSGVDGVRRNMQAVSGNSGTVELEAHKDYEVYYDSTGAAPSCTLSGPGSARSGARGGGSGANWGSEQWQPLRLSEVGSESFQVSEGGDYTVDCQGGTKTMVSTPLDMDKLFLAIVGGAVLFVGGGLFFLLLVLGIVLWAVGARRVRRVRQRY